MATNRPRISHYLEAAGWLLAAAVLKFLPRRAEIRLADAFGAIAFSLLRLRRDVALANLRSAFPEKPDAERKRIARKSYQHLVLSFFEFIQRDPVFGREGIHLRRGVNEEHYRELLARQIPVVVLTGHMGNWESMPECVDPGEVEIAALAKPLHNPIIDSWANRGREMHRVQVVPLSASLKGAVDALRRGKYLVLLGDQDAGRNGIFVDFLGRPASTATGPAVFAYKLDLPVLPVFSIRADDAKRSLSLLFFPPIWPDSTKPRDEEVRRITELHVRALEQAVRRHPENYFWIHRRWKTKPKRRHTEATQN